jgi:hypothetical protein
VSELEFLNTLGGVIILMCFSVSVTEQVQVVLENTGKADLER